MKSKILAAIHEQRGEQYSEHHNELYDEHDNEHHKEHHSEFIPEFDAKGKSVYMIAHEDTGWLQHPIRGIDVKPLAGDKERGYSTLLMRLAPGTIYPTHSHAGAEQCFVVQGSINVMGKTLNAGDFLSTQTHAEHGDISSAHGATVLLVVAREDFRKSAWKVASASIKHRLKRLVG
jgi:quercetin dioxygenase-like cupin family protein